MASTPLRDVPDDVMEHYTRLAAHQGISRNALLVRILTDGARRDDRPPLTLHELRASADRTKDLLDAAVMADAWS